jgi:hypothetical protein
MRAGCWIAAALLMSACSDESDRDVPVDAYINLIEQKLANHPCVGELAQWERSYRFAKPGGISAFTAHADHDVIEFHLRRAGTTTIAPGRNVMRRGSVDDWPDGKNIRYIDGRYKIGENVLRVGSCVPLKPR